MTAARSHELVRPRLLGQLDGSEHVVLWAAAGMGKSTLLRQWARQTIGAVVVGTRTEVAGTVQSLLDDPGVTLVIDDADQLGADARHSLTQALRFDRGARVVLAGRSDLFPADPSLWLRTRQVRPRDLLLTEDEIAQLLACRGASATAARELQLRTGGWPAAVSFELRHLVDGRVQPDADRSSADLSAYLDREVLSAWDAAERDVVSLCALDQVVSPELAVAASAQPTVPDLLRRLSAGHGLVDEGPDGRFVFVPALQRQLAQQLRENKPDSRRAALARAIEHLISVNDLAGALRQSYASGDRSLVRDLLDTHGLELAFRGIPLLREAAEDCEMTYPEASALVLLLLDSPHFPDRDAAARRLAALPQSGSSALVNQLWRDTLDDIESGVPSGQPAGSGAEQLLAEYVKARLRARHGQNPGERATGANTLHRLAVTAEEAGLLWLKVLAAEALLNYALGTKDWPSIDFIVRTAAELPPIDEIVPSAAGDGLFVFSAAVNYQRCEEVSIQQLRAMVERCPPVEPQLRRRATAVRLVAELGESWRPEQIVSLEHFVSSEVEQDAAIMAFTLFPRLSAADSQGNRPLLQRIHWQISRACGSDSLEAQVAKFVLAADPSTERALRAALDVAPSFDPLTSIYAQVRLAVYYDLRGTATRAQDQLLAAVQAADRLQLARPFAHHRGDALPLLRMIAPGLGVWSQAATTIADLAAAVVTGPGTSKVVLSVVERGLLGELTTYRGVAEIAKRRCVSPNTVKTQLRVLYRKLGVNNRAAAVKVAQSTGLL